MLQSIDTNTTSRPRRPLVLRSSYRILVTVVTPFSSPSLHHHCRITVVVIVVTSSSTRRRRCPLVPATSLSSRCGRGRCHNLILNASTEPLDSMAGGCVEEAWGARARRRLEGTSGSVRRTHGRRHRAAWMVRLRTCRGAVGSTTPRRRVVAGRLVAIWLPDDVGELSEPLGSCLRGGAVERAVGLVVACLLWRKWQRVVASTSSHGVISRGGVWPK